MAQVVTPAPSSQSCQPGTADSCVGDASGRRLVLAVLDEHSSFDWMALRRVRARARASDPGAYDQGDGRCVSGSRSGRTSVWRAGSAPGT